MTMKNNLIIPIIMLVTMGFSMDISATDYHGMYQGEVISLWLDNGRDMKILEDFSFTDPDGSIWIATEGSIIDGASIPQVLWSLVGSPFLGKYRNATVIHDIACRNKIKSWQQVHLAFYHAMKASGVGELRASVMYNLVYYFGPRWDQNRTSTSPLTS